MQHLSLLLRERRRKWPPVYFIFLIFLCRGRFCPRSDSEVGVVKHIDNYCPGRLLAVGAGRD